MTRRPPEDLFEDTRMSFGQHLEELRGTLVRSLIGIAIGCLLGFLLADSVVNFLQTPLTSAIKQFNDKYALADYTKRIGFYPPEIHDRIERDGLAPDSVYVDPGQLVQAIRQISPQSLAEIDLTPYRFSPREILQARSIAGALVEGARSASPGSGRAEDDPRVDLRIQAIAGCLGEPDRSALNPIMATPPSADDAPFRRPVVDVLNRVLEDRRLHDSPAFADLLRKQEWSWDQLLVPGEQNQLYLMKQQVDEHPDDVELSRRLNRLLVAHTFANEIAPPTIDLVPLAVWRSVTEGTQALSPHEVFMVWMKAAVITGLIISAPWVFIQLWHFVAAGLYPHEQKYVYFYLPISLILFVLGVCLAFFFVFEPVLQFLFSFNASMGIKPQLRIGEWLTFVLFLPLGFGVAFQLPLVMLFLQRVGLVPVSIYTSHWRIAIMIISVLSMLLTPADPISMILLGVPLTVLYFLGIGLCRWMPAPQNPFGDPGQPAVTAD